MKTTMKREDGEKEQEESWECVVVYVVMMVVVWLVCEDERAKVRKKSRKK
jgi:hypothetical protein